MKRKILFFIISLLAIAGIAIVFIQNSKKTIKTTKKENTVFNNNNSIKKDSKKNSLKISDSIFIWDQKKLDWVSKKQDSEKHKKSSFRFLKQKNISNPIEIKWEILNDIQYKQKYFEGLDLIAFAPIFNKNLEFLDKREVIIKGFVIPFEENKNTIALSANPYSACFFCGQASPASVISVFLKNDKKRYATDDFKKFKGTLYLNYDDPSNFYYLLKEAEEI